MKKKTQNMTMTEIKETALGMINSLISKLDQSEIHLDLIRKLELNSDDQKDDFQSIPKSLDAELNQTLMNARSFLHSKGKMYTPEQVNEFGFILDRFPNDHAKICKLLKIPKSSFLRLKHEWSTIKNTGIESKRKYRECKGLSYLEQMYVRKLVKPPTSPKTVKKIQK